MTNSCFEVPRAAPYQIDEDEPGAAFVRGTLDLGEAVDSRGINAGDKAEIEDKEANAGCRANSTLTFW